MKGFWSGAHHTIIDPYALADPFLARLPITTEQPWRIGHFARSLPAGYYETADTGISRFHDPKLAEYYSKIILIHQSPDLFSIERLKTIIQMNLGAYDHLIAHIPKPSAP